LIGIVPEHSSNQSDRALYSGQASSDPPRRIRWRIFHQFAGTGTANRGRLN